MKKMAKIWQIWIILEGILEKSVYSFEMVNKYGTFGP